MSKKVKVTYTVTYDLSESDLAQEYREWLDDYRDTKGMRNYFAVDRFVGHDNLRFFDEAATLTVEES